MKYAKYDNYDKSPAIAVEGRDGAVLAGWDAIARELKARAAGREKTVVAVDCYAGVNIPRLTEGLVGLNAAVAIDAEACMWPAAELDARLSGYLGEDRVFGFMCRKPLSWLFDPQKLEAARKRAAAAPPGIVLVYGAGAGLIARGDVYIYADMARWEIQNRYKAGMPNLRADNGGAPFLSKYKRGYFVEWRMLDGHKKTRLHDLDYILDTNSDTPKLLRGDTFRAGLEQAARKPFRLVPYFDPGVWGGQWMKDVCGLDKSAANYAWAFDGVPEENSLCLQYGGERVEIPAADLVFYRPRQLLGERVHARFGDEFPIRFDFLDTMDGGNLSLQVHPLTEYIQRAFGMNYTQDESYYILDCKDDCYVYLGVKDGVNRDELYAALQAGQAGKGFDAEKFANKVKIKKHDHMLIPAGTVHCSGKDAMVLEISATPYIFTFKLWDWGRVGLDGLPRPTHIDHGIRNVQFDRTPAWVAAELTNRFETLQKTETALVERTGLHEREFIETLRYTVTAPVRVESGNGVNMLNVVDGSAAVVKSPEGRFRPFTAHYAETFIVPCAAGPYTVEPAVKGEKISVIRAAVR
ncbi:MAG: class I mannose-6-phosphate isomerase [Clostridiales bacterium]|jgi:mannose-6-phosphate isomerase class I|nr:class I mannose-6-phosphate isomerase [Clostridiales bacterium]